MTLEKSLGAFEILITGSDTTKIHTTTWIWIYLSMDINNYQL